MHAPKAVIFDLGKVLLDFDYRRLADNLVQHCSVDVDAINQLINQSPLLYQLETGLISGKQFFSEVQKATKFCGEDRLFFDHFADIFTPIPSMIELHGALKTAGVPTYIFSNTNEIAEKHIRERYPFFNEFTGYFLSYQEQVMKPDPKIYKIIEERLGLRGRDLLYIDDREENIETGLTLGWRAIHHTSADATIAEVQRLWPL